MKTVKFGIFGLGRGSNFISSVLKNDGEIVAICDKNAEKCEQFKKMYGKDLAIYHDFDEFINHKGLEAVMLCNYFNEHAPYAIKALEKGLHVLSECTSNSTMAEGVALVRAAEKSGAFYMLSENYPFMKFNQEMRRVYRGGSLGKVLFAEGEYNHPLDLDGEREYYIQLHPYPEHWRNYLSRTYYITHSLAPLMYITGAVPKRVTALPCFAPIEEFGVNGSAVGDRAAIITTLNDDDSVFRVTGCAAFGAHENSYRVCGTKGQIENVRGGEGKVMLRYNKWDMPDGALSDMMYTPQWPADVKKLIGSAGHGGGDFFVIREFFNCIREGRRPEFDEYFGTTCASVAILGHRSMLERGVPYDLPDFHKEEDRKKYENDTLTPFYGPNGEKPTLPACSHPDYKVPDELYQKYLSECEKYKKM